MNWTRGLLRVWVVLSVIWVAVVGTLAIKEWYDDPWRVVSTEPVTPPPGFKVAEPATAHIELSERLQNSLAWTFGPPVVVFLVGASGVWAAKGFRV